MTDKEADRVDAWTEPGGPTMVKVVTTCGDPVELAEHELRAFIQKLVECLRQTESGPTLRDSIFLEVTRAEALVILHVLSKRSTTVAATEDPAEEQALDNLECVIERVLAEPFAEGYGEKLLAAKKLICPA
jgi:hypothetical protein